MTTPEGVRLLKQHNLAEGLRAVKEVDYRTFEHDAWVTDVRILFESLLCLDGWIAERRLKKKNVKKKVPDGIIPDEDYHLVIEVEKTLKNKRYYQRIFTDTCLGEYKKGEIYYIMANEADKQWLMKQAKTWESIYFATMDELMQMQWDAVFRNAKGEEVNYHRLYQGGPHFNIPDGKNPHSKYLEEFFESEEDREQDEEEYKQLRAQGLSDDEIEKLLDSEEGGEVSEPSGFPRPGKN